MPTYQYVCKNCGYELEEMQRISEPPLTHCPRCRTDSLARAAGPGSGLIFKGTGFYMTDYKKQSASHSKPDKSGHAQKGEKQKDQKGKKPDPEGPPSKRGSEGPDKPGRE